MPSTDGVDALNGGSGGDTLSGSGGGDVIRGLGGDDVLYGHGVTDETDPLSGQITATRIASGYAFPLFASSAPGDPGRLYVVEKGSGAIRILDLATNTKLATPFLDLPAAALATAGERGLLGMAFHPDYAANGRFYLYLTRVDGDIEVREFTRSSANVADPASNRLILRIEHSEFSNHNGGWIGFGPDGKLYVAVGDGGSGGDPNGNGQSLNTLLAKMLRIDVDGDDFAADPDRNYAIPVDNPFVGQAGAMGEIYAYGLRNPFRNSFDSATGDLYIADVGQGRREEINYIAAGGGGGQNFGWRVREGDLGYPTPTTPNPGTFDEPIAVYDHTRPNGGLSVTGGYVNRGPGGLPGAYLFADYVTNNLWSLKVENGGVIDYTLRTAQVVVDAGTLNQIASFAVDGSGRQYAIGLDGEIHRLDFSAAAADGADTILGGLGADRIYGGAGADRLYGGEGVDLLVGGIGADLLNGEAGADTMRGGRGDDIYVVDALDDIVDETGGDGNDAIKSTVDVLLPDGVEALTLAAAARGEGNGLANRMNGSAGADTLLGGAGADVLDGHAGRDVLTGGAGADTFVFSDARDSVIATSMSDVITDFSRADGDRIYLFGIDAVAGTTANEAFTWIGGGGFVVGQAGRLRAFYNADAGMGVVQGETNGDGVADFQILIPSAVDPGLVRAVFVL